MLLKIVSLLDAIHWFHQTWSETEPHTIKKCFAKCGFTLAESTADSPNEDISPEDEHELPLVVINMPQNLFGVPIEKTNQIDENLATAEEVTDWSLPAKLLKSFKPCDDTHSDTRTDDDDDGG
ncbi:unnamed protein product [Caretta caretta]